MALLNKIYLPGLILLLAVPALSTARAATTEITADIIDGACNISFSDTELVFATKRSPQFSTGTAEVQPLNVNVNCTGLSGLKPSLKVSGDSSGVTDIRLSVHLQLIILYTIMTQSMKRQGVGYCNGIFSILME